MKDLVENSEFINFPIYMWESKEESEEVPIEDDDEKSPTKKEEEDDEDEEDEGEDDEDEDENDGERRQTKTKTVTNRLGLVLLNDSKAIWLRSSSVNRKSTPIFTRRCRR